jgi:hypothetical protein
MKIASHNSCARRGINRGWPKRAPASACGMRLQNLITYSKTQIVAIASAPVDDKSDAKLAGSWLD